MHMVFLYYVICVGGTLAVSLWYMNKYWTKERFDALKKGDDEK